MKKAWRPRRRRRSPANMKLATGSSAKARTSIVGQGRDVGGHGRAHGRARPGSRRCTSGDGSPAASVHGRVLGESRHHGQRAALAPQDPPPQALRDRRRWDRRASAGTTYHDPSSISASSWPESQPA